jgi:hypothetical protein
MPPREIVAADFGHFFAFAVPAYSALEDRKMNARQTGRQDLPLDFKQQESALALERMQLELLVKRRLQSVFPPASQSCRSRTGPPGPSAATAPPVLEDG